MLCGAKHVQSKQCGGAAVAAVRDAAENVWFPVCRGHLGKTPYPEHWRVRMLGGK